LKKHISGDELTTIPYVGPSIASDFCKIGISKVSDLRGKNPEEIYFNICATQGCQVDRCVLYICRSAVYYAENKTPDPEKLKWWNWTDKKLRYTQNK
jgi:hypothetical protein